MNTQLKHRLVGLAVIASFIGLAVPFIWQPKVNGMPEHPEVEVLPTEQSFVSQVVAVDNRSVLPMNLASKVEQANQQFAKIEAEQQWVIQVGSFSEQANAARLAKQLELQSYPVIIETTKKQNKTFYRVRIGPKNKAILQRYQQQLAEKLGLSDTRMMSYP